MRHGNRWMIAVVIIIVALQLTACGQSSASSASKDIGGSTDQPAKLEHLAGTDLNRVVLSAEAAKRLGIQTATVRDAKVQGKLRKVVPYAAMIYDLHGEPWVYTNPSPLTFVRDHISVDYIDSDLVVLSAGPPSGTKVVTVGVPELYGTEFEGGLQP